MTLAAGRPLSHYQILGPLGAGAMGEVYRARDTRLEREVAIKVLPEHFASDEERLRRFEREARTLATLNHPNVAQIFGVDQVDDVCFLVLELVPGETLEQRIARGPLPLDDTIDLCGQIASGLEAAHEAGVIHRDLKPANVRITPDGKVKVLDFGLAKPAHESKDVAKSTDSVLSTEAGRLLGTPTYMAPEQARGKQIDRRIDVWAFGCVLYECLTGQRAFAGETLTDVFAAVLEREPDWTKLPSSTPPHLRELLRRCLAKDARSRWRDVGDVRIELERPSTANDASGVGARVLDDGARRSHALARIVPWSIAAAALAFAVWIGTRATSTPAESRRMRDLRMVAPEGGLLQLGSNRGTGVISPDGRHVAFVAATARGRGLWIRSLEDEAATLVPDSEAAFYPFWSPDGRWLAYFGEGRLQKLELGGGMPELVCTAAWARGSSWAEDGRILLVPRSGGTIHLVAASGGAAVPVTELDATQGETAHYWPQWLGPDRFLYFVRSSDPNHEGVYSATIDAAGKSGPAKRIMLCDASAIVVPARGERAAQLVWPRADGGLQARPIDPATAEFLGPAVALGITVGISESQRLSYVSASREGTLVTAPPFSNRYQTGWLDRSGKGSRYAQLIGVGRYNFKVSPDSKQLAYVKVRAGDGDLWMYDLETDREVQITSGIGFDESCAWSPDGKELLFQRGSAGAVGQLARADARSGSDVRVVADLAREFNPLSWSADGWIIGLHPGDRIGLEALKLGAALQPILLIDDIRGIAAAWERRVAWTSSTPGGVATFVAEVEFGAETAKLGARRLIAGIPSPRRIDWCRQGSELLVLGGDNRYYSVAVGTGASGIEVGAPQLLFELPLSAESHAVSPDGERIYVEHDLDAHAYSLRVIEGWEEKLGPPAR